MNTNKAIEILRELVPIDKNCKEFTALKRVEAELKKPDYELALLAIDSLDDLAEELPEGDSYREYVTHVGVIQSRLVEQEAEIVRQSSELEIRIGAAVSLEPQTLYDELKADIVTRLYLLELHDLQNIEVMYL